MALRKAFCPNCGQPTQIDDTKEFCFCISCGNKINVPRREQPAIETSVGVSEHEPRQRAQSAIEEEHKTASDFSSTIKAPKDKMKEVAFYYQLSVGKREYANANAEPTYYLKGQDLLVDLSQQYQSDYEVWWELCKPMDFDVVVAGEKSDNPCGMNDSYFDKALDLAPLDRKMELIEQHDKYIEIKASVLKQIQDEIAVKEAEERARLDEEQRKQRESDEEKRRREKETAEKNAVEFARAQQEMSVNVWESLKNKDYSVIDNCYFQFATPEGIKIVATLKVMANILYLSAFHIDASKNNAAYLDQSIAVHFGDNGFIIKFDNKPVTVRGWNPNANTLQVMVNPQSGYVVNNFPLVKDSAYVTGISKEAKKPLMSFKKVFY